MAVYKEAGGYTEKAEELDRKVRKLLDRIIKEEMENGMTPEEIMYIIESSAKMSVLRYVMEKRIK